MPHITSALDQLIRDIIANTVPLGQLDITPEEAMLTKDLGLGFIYYSLVRTVRPNVVVVIGSYRGFSVVCFALGLRDNEAGHLHFIDASKVDDFWVDGDRAQQHFGRFGLKDYITLHNRTTDDCLRTVTPFNGGAPFIDILLLDGDHRRDAVAQDFARFGSLVRDGGFICLHDSRAGGLGKTPLQVGEFLATLRIELFESLSINCGKGLTVVKKLASTVLPLDRLSRRADVNDCLEAVLCEARRECRDLSKLLRLKDLVTQVFEGVDEQERLMEIRQQYLRSSAQSMGEQLSHLKAELKAIKARQG